jgi:hypothetical protein
MPNTLTKIAFVISNGSASQIAFNAIPQTYTDLLIKASSRSAAVSISALITAFNADTSAINSTTRLIGSGTAISSDRFTAQNYGSVYNNGENISTFTASVFASSEWYIPNYANTTTFKNYTIDGVSETNASAANQNFLAGLWRSTAAITSISILDANGANLTAGSSFTLYGINKTA